MTHQWLQLLAVYEVELGAEVVKMLVAGVDVGLGSHQNNAVEVVDVDVHKDPEESTQDFLTDLNEVLGEWNS